VKNFGVGNPKDNHFKLWSPGEKNVRKHSQLLSDLWNSQFFSSVDDSQYMVHFMAQFKNCMLHSIENMVLPTKKIWC